GAEMACLRRILTTAEPIQAQTWSSGTDCLATISNGLTSTICGLPSAGKAAVTIKLGEQALTISMDLASLPQSEPRESEFEVYHVDTSSVVSGIQDHFCRFPNIADALNGVPVLECSDEQIDDLKFLTQVSYTRARVYSVEEEGLTRPFFEVEVNGMKYD